MKLWTKWMVYFVNSEGIREGCETIDASCREEAVRIYRMFFNIEKDVDVKVIPSVGVKVW